MGIISNKTTTQVGQSYSYEDKRPVAGLNYYRLRQVDFDGAFEYSDIRSVELKGGVQDVQVYPNPVQVGSWLTINFARHQDTDATVRVFDATGKMMHQEILSGQYNQIGYGDLPAGIYQLELRSDSKIWWERLVVQ